MDMKIRIYHLHLESLDYYRLSIDYHLARYKFSKSCDKLKYINITIKTFIFLH